jgi:hypothetical protein
MYASTSSAWHHITKNFIVVCPYTYFTHTSTTSHLFPELVLFAQPAPCYPTQHYVIPGTVQYAVLSSFFLKPICSLHQLRSHQLISNIKEKFPFLRDSKKYLLELRVFWSYLPPLSAHFKRHGPSNSTVLSPCNTA